jgi:hypothetical protein
MTSPIYKKNTFWTTVPLVASVFTLFPRLTLVQAQTGRVEDFDSFISFVFKVINALIPVIISLAVLVFIWGVFRYVVSSDEEAKGKGKNMMLWGIVGLFVMVSVWGLVNILIKTFKFNTNAPDLPQLPGQGRTPTPPSSGDSGEGTWF